MELMYFYFNPISKQYLFPVNFQNYPIFNSLYHPRRMVAKLMWWIWKNSSLLRNICSERDISNIIPLKHLVPFLPLDCVLAINRGTRGTEQKITALCFSPSTNASLFLKYAETKTSRENVSNESFILKQLIHLDFVPRLLHFFNKEDFTLIATDVFDGNKPKNNSLNEEILKILLVIGKQQVSSSSDRIYRFGLITAFAHGDFCPWNIFFYGNDIKVFDWEMAGEYPLGYDLFTYIFQVEFLVNRKNRHDLLLKYNNRFIEEYFQYWGIENWKTYLLAFAQLKVKLELQKNNTTAVSFYKSLEQYATTV